MQYFGKKCKLISWEYNNKWIICQPSGGCQKLTGGFQKNSACFAYQLAPPWPKLSNRPCLECQYIYSKSPGSGHLLAACIIIQEKLNKPLLWFPCRHHIVEVILSAKKRFESQKFQQCWDLLPHHSKELNRFDPSSLSKTAQDLFMVLRENTIKVFKNNYKIFLLGG